MKRTRNGITLVALVITIIILLILAGISIVGILGENGLIIRTKQASIARKKAQYFEEINLEIFNEQTERFQIAKEETFIQSIKTRIETKNWVNQVLMCKEENTLVQEELNSEHANILIVEIKDGYEIIIDVKNSGLTASIRDSFEKLGKKYKVEYDINGGTGYLIESQEIRQGFSVILQENTSTRTGYKFVGWCENLDGTGDVYSSGSIYTPKKDIKLYAIWSEKTVTISFEANAGEDVVTGTMESKTISPNTNIVIASNAFVRKGYSFVKWNTKPDGTGTDFLNKATINTSDDITLYAVWGPVLISKITLSESSVGMIVGDTKTITATITPSEVTNSNLKWESSNTSVVTVSDTGKTVTITAKGEGNATITAKAQDGSNVSETCIVYCVRSEEGYLVKNGVLLKNMTFSNATNNGTVTYAGKSALKVYIYGTKTSNVSYNCGPLNIGATVNVDIKFINEKTNGATCKLFASVQNVATGGSMKPVAGNG